MLKRALIAGAGQPALAELTTYFLNPFTTYRRSRSKMENRRLSVWQSFSSACRWREQRRPPLMRIEELIVTSCGSRCVSACQPIVSSSRQIVEVLRTHQQTTDSEVVRGTSVHLPQNNSQKRNSTRCSRPTCAEHDRWGGRKTPRRAPSFGWQTRIFCPAGLCARRACPERASGFRLRTVVDNADAVRVSGRRRRWSSRRTCFSC